MVISIFWKQRMSYQMLQRPTLLLYLPQSILKRGWSLGCRLNEDPSRLWRPGLATWLTGCRGVVGMRRGRRRLDRGRLWDRNASQDWGGGEVAIIKGDVRTVEELRGTEGDALDRCHLLGSGEQRLILLLEKNIWKCQNMCEYSSGKSLNSK